MREPSLSSPFFRPERRSLKVCSAVLLFWIGALPAAGQEILTLDRALEIAARNSLAAEASSLDSAAAREETATARALYFPEVVLEGGHVNLDNDPAFRFGPVTFPAGDQVYWKYDLSVRQVLWDGGRRREAVAAGRAGESAAARGGAEAVRRLQAEVVARYAGALIFKAQGEVADQRREALEDHLRTVRDLFEQGVVARNDLLRTEVALRSVEDQRRSLASAYATAVEELNRALGLDPATPQTLPGALGPAPLVPWGEAEIRARAVQGNDGLKALDAKIAALEAALSLREKDYAPVLLAEAGHGYEQNRYMAYPHVNRLFVGLSWNVYDGGARAARVRQARAQVDKARRERVEAGREVENAAARAFREFADALRELDTARLNVEASLENLRIVQDQYREGMARSTDVLDAESLLAESRFQAARTHYHAYARQAALLAALGEDLRRFFAGAQVPASSEEK
ncbi:MAG: TolC family protein [Acidobacteriota bacterium]